MYILYNVLYFLTFMGVRPAVRGPRTTCEQQEGSRIGVLLPVTETELGHFDRRELGYRRQVHPVPFLNREEDYAEPGRALFLQAKKQQQEKEAFELESISSDDVNFLSSSSSVEESDDNDADHVSLWVYVLHVQVLRNHGRCHGSCSTYSTITTTGDVVGVSPSSPLFLFRVK